VEGRGYMGEPDVDGMLFKMDIKESECEGIDWIQFAQDWVQWRSMEKAVMYLWVP
jgi:hypothetical protein